MARPLRLLPVRQRQEVQVVLPADLRRHQPAPSSRRPTASTTRALRIMTRSSQEHAGNPEAWGQKAQLLYGHGKVEEAEEALEKAFAINPNYPFGLLLRAVFRYQEGEIPGALLLARRAAEAYDPEAHDPTWPRSTRIIFECELKLNRPVAARAALRIVVHDRAGRAGGARSTSRRSSAPRAGCRPAPPRVHAARPAAGVSGAAGPPGTRRLARLPPRQAERTGPRLRAADARGRRRRPRLVQPRPGPRLAGRQPRPPWRPWTATSPWRPTRRGPTTAAALAEVLRCGAGLEKKATTTSTRSLCNSATRKPVSDLAAGAGTRTGG